MRKLAVSIDAVWVSVAVAVPGLLTLLSPLGTVDLAYQIRTGDLILAHRAIPSVDTFTFSAAGAPWTVQQWGAAVFLAAGFSTAGWSGILVLTATIVAAAFALVLAACLLMGAAPRTAAVLTVVAYVTAFGALAPRAQLFAVLCFAATLALVAGRSRSPRRFLLTPLILLAWANLHGSFALGLLVIGWGLLEDLSRRRPAWRRDVLVLTLSAVATCVTPFGPAVWLYAVELASNPTISSLIAEWQSMTIRSPIGMVFAASAIAVGTVLVARRRLVTWPTLLWLAGLFLLCLWTQRAIVWWALGAAVAVAGLLAAEPAADPATRLDRWLSTTARRHISPVNGALTLGIVTAPVILAFAVLVRPSDPVTGPAGVLRDAPPGLTAAVAEQAKPADRILNAQRWGSWLEWAVPEALVFVDSRIEIVPREVWDDYIAVTRGRFDWRSIVDRIAPDMIVASRADQQALIDAIAADPASGWREVYADDDGAVYTRNP